MQNTGADSALPLKNHVKVHFDHLQNSHSAGYSQDFIHDCRSIKAALSVMHSECVRFVNKAQASANTSNLMHLVAMLKKHSLLTKDIRGLIDHALNTQTCFSTGEMEALAGMYESVALSHENILVIARQGITVH